jgi:hypothetical protein
MKMQMRIRRNQGQVFPCLVRGLGLLLSLSLLLVALSQTARAWPGDLFLAWSSTETDYTYDIAWGDWDNDGDLDLAVGNYSQPNRVYRNDGGSLSLAWSSLEIDATASVAWGDWDGDGDLDLAVGNDSDQSNRVYRNDGGSLSLAWSSPETDRTRSVAWGDWDGDGDLDLAVGNSFLLDGQPNRVYRNDGGSLSLAWSSPETDVTRSVAWGDWDGDGDLDLAVGNQGEPNRVYENDGGSLSLAWSSPETDDTRSVAWGDWDGDGDFDLAVGNCWGQVNRVYENDGGSLALAWSSPETDDTNSVAWGDWDVDGDLDLAVGNHGEPNRVYANGGGSLTLAWSSPETDPTGSVAWGDWDGDGDLDLAIGNSHVGGAHDEPNRVYANNGVRLTLAWSSPETDATAGVAWGDWDGDGDLDLAVGNSFSQPNRVYRNDDGSLALAWSSPETDTTTSVAWGDWDGDGDLDLAVGNWSDDPNRIYANSGGSLALAWSSSETDPTDSVAWGDWDGDGDLDLAVGNSGQANRVYANSGGSLALAWSSDETDHTESLAWGDWDGDGDLDLVAGNYLGPNRVYANSGGGLSLAWSSPETDDTWSLAWGDWDGDGNLDLAVGNYFEPNRIYANSGGSLSLAWSSPETDRTESLAWGDWDGDSDLDLAVGSYYGQPIRVYANGGGSLGLAWTSLELDETTSLAWGDWDGDGDLDLVTGNYWGQCNRVYRNHSADSPALADSTPKARIAYPGPAAAPFFASATVLEGPTLPVTYTLFDPEGDPVRYVRAHYSLNGGSQWRPAVAAAGTVTTNLAASITGTVHTYTWDVLGSGVFGASDSTVFRLDVYQGFTGPGPYQYPFRTARTLPFRVRGSQVRVVSGTVPISQALVYRQPAGQSSTYQPYSDSAGRPFRTNPIGYLQGRGEIALGDHLVALAPITATDSYTLYYTNATPTLNDLDAYTVNTLGVQTLTVSSDHPLILFNLDVSLEWDARYDEQFMSQLEFNLQRTSEILYDWTNGQAALGQTTIYHDREHWLDAHIRVYATNQMRPNAAQGGIITEIITDPLTSTVTYQPGQVRMGAVWNRYGEPGGNLGEDWPRTLGHELGHFAFFLDDNYLGFDENGLLIPVDGCPGAMSDPYRDDYSEFHPDDGWLPACENTLSHQITGRSDWATITTLYPWLNGTATNTGPSGLPLAVTEIQVVEPITPSAALEVPIFYLSQEGHRVQPGTSARAFLFQDDWLTDLGRPTVDQVLARGARPGDRVCVYELAAERLGCETISLGDEQLALVSNPGWLPEVIISPVTSRTIAITVTNVPTGLSLEARLFPVTDPAPDAISLTPADGVHAGTFNADEPAIEGYVQVWVDETEPRREIVTNYALGGGPGYVRGRGGYVRGRGGYVRGRGAPAVSADGQVILFEKDLDFEEGTFFALQAATIIPSPPPWTTVVGQGYRLSASANAPDLDGTSISFSYLGSEVPPGEEDWLRVHFWDGVSWQQLSTSLDTYHNNASAPTQGEGLYVLMCSLEIPLYGPGWNLFAYPVQGTRPVTQALLSISGYYTTVYGYDATDTTDPWKVYDVTVPDWVNDLNVLEFSHGYWINVSEAITLCLRGASAPSAPAGSSPQSMQGPPATYYGLVEAGEGFAPTAGLPVLAQVDGHLCGQGQTMEVSGEVVYSVNVFADGPGGAAGCGAPGRDVRFQVDSQVMEPAAAWDNGRVWELTLSPAFQYRVYLPLVLR